MSGPGTRRGTRLGGLAALLAVAGLAGAALLLGRPEGPPRVRATLSLAEALGGGGDRGFARALTPRPLAFPADHGPHPGFRTEWWYCTGNLETAEGRPVGFQLTFFRVALAPGPIVRESAWGATQLYLAHLAVTDVAGRRFRAFERAGRGAMRLAGATAAPLRVWLEDWRLEGQGEGGPPFRVVAGEEDVGVDLMLESAKAPVLHGDRGLSRKGTQAGNASYYYSLSRMPTRGAVRIGGETLAVSGLSWLDREWGTTALEPDQVGWDWFALQLEDGRELMLYLLRRRDGATDPVSRGTLVRADGSTRALEPGAWRLTVLDRWRSPRGGAPYPARWRLAIPSEALEVEIVPLLADQELDLAVRYWEGAVRLAGRSGGASVGGRGYVELTGYAGVPGSVRE